MGKNKGDANRSKARPSSSSLAASLLQTSAGSAVGFGGYVGSARIETSSSADGELLMDVDGEAALHLRRLSKKDSTTKLKALTALIALFKERPSAELSALMPSWVFEYKRLVQDGSRQVRESTHIAMTSLVTSIGRGLAPHLRSLMGAWWVAQFDPSREVLEAAQTSFQVAFPGQKKRLEVLIFSANEIFTDLDENLKLTPQMISDKATSIEESTEKHERVVSSSLLALAAIIDILVGPSKTGSATSNSSVDAEVAAKTRILVKEAATKLCRNHKLLREYVKSKSSRIRSAVYQSLRAFIQHMPQVFRDEDMDLVSGSILGTFSEKDTACHQPMWDMVLLFAQGFPQAWGAAAIRKTALPRLFSFLRNGCYRSQQISYPLLLPLLSLIPPEYVTPGQSFLMEFFKSLWQGRGISQLGSMDRQALLKAVQEDLIWALKNAKRYCGADGSNVVELQNALIDGVLLRILWCDYVGAYTSQSIPLAAFVMTSGQETNSCEMSLPAISSEFMQELGSCIVDIVQILSGYDNNLLRGFWVEFQNICQIIVQEAGSRWQSAQQEDSRIFCITEFFVLLGVKTLKGEKREDWSLKCAVRPFVTKSFPTIKAMGHPESIRLVANLTSVYGPTAFLELSMSTDKSSTNQNDQVLSQQDLDDHGHTLNYFKEDLVPWCLLDGKDELNGPKAELILAFMESPGFQGEWEFVIGHVTGWLDTMRHSVDLQQVGVLATLLEKVRDSLKNKEIACERKEISVDVWTSPRVDKAAITVASSIHLGNFACFRLLRSVLGGSSSEQSIMPLVSDKAAVQIFEILLKRILTVLSASTMNWIKSIPVLIHGSRDSDMEQIPVNEEINIGILDFAKSAIEIVKVCLPSLLRLDRDFTVGGKLLAAIFCLNWACPVSEKILLDEENDLIEEYDSVDSDDDTTLGKNDTSVGILTELSVSTDLNGGTEAVEVEPSIVVEQGWRSLRESLDSVLQEISPSFCKSFSALTKFRLRQVLIECLRKAVLDEDFETTQRMASRCVAWVQELVDYTCAGPDEVSEAVDSLLACGDSWPRWVTVPSPVQMEKGENLPIIKAKGQYSEVQMQRHDRFAGFADVLCKTLGQREIFLGSDLLTGKEAYIGEGSLETSSQVNSGTNDRMCRTWLAVELLCTWEWCGGSALLSVLPFLYSCSGSDKLSNEYYLLWNTIQTLFLGASNSCDPTSQAMAVVSAALEEDIKSMKEPFLRALLVLLEGLLGKEDGWGRTDAVDLFGKCVTKNESGNFVSPVCDLHILPHVLSALMPTLRKRDLDYASANPDKEWQALLQCAVSDWLQRALTGPPLVACEGGLESAGTQWIQVVVACFPLNSAGGAATMASASSMQVSLQEKELLLALLRKQFSREAIAAVVGFAAARRHSPEEVITDVKSRLLIEVTLAKLVAVAIAYCWLDFGVEEWEFILSRLRTWLEEAVVGAEEFTEAVVDVVKDFPHSVEVLEPGPMVEELGHVVNEKGINSVELSTAAVSVFSLLRGLYCLDGAESTDAITNMQAANWKTLEMRAMEEILRFLLALGLAESAVVNSCVGERAGGVIASRRNSQVQLWDNVADVALSASCQAREAAIRSVDLWGVGNGAISALYAFLFSLQPTMSLQCAAYNFLSTGQILDMAVTCGITSAGEGESKDEEGGGEDSQEALPVVVAQIRPELISVLETSPSVILHSPLTSSLRVRYLLGWSLTLTRIQSLTASSSARERLVQYVQDSDTSPTLLDCLFQHIPLEQNLGTSGSRRRSLVAGMKINSAAAPATRAAAIGSVAFAIEELWPVQKESLVTLAGAIYGLMLLVLPACVRVWFTGLRDKAMATAIEAFTTIHCSPQLLVDEFAKVQASAVAEEDFSIRANRSLREVTAIYKKEEAGMDIVIRMPACYPLRAVSVECTRRMGIDETLLRKWILSMAAFLRNQNGAVAEAVQMWKRNIDREFEGVEPCPICYSIIHTSNHSLAKLACKTCRNKFHSACLYKWFSTSQQSTCPLCKTPF